MGARDFGMPILVESPQESMDGIAENVGKKAPWILQSRVVSELGMGMAASVYESRVVSESGMGMEGKKSDSIERIITLKNNEHKQTER